MLKKNLLYQHKLKPIQKSKNTKLEKKSWKTKIEKKQELVKYSNENIKEQTTQKMRSTVENNIAQTALFLHQQKHYKWKRSKI